MKMLAAGICMAVGVIGPGLGQGFIAGKTMEAASRNPEMSTKLFTNMMIGLAFVESLAIYCFVIALIILFVV